MLKRTAGACLTVAMTLAMSWDTADVTLVNNLFSAGTSTAALFDTVDANGASSGKRVGAAGMIPTAQQDHNGYYRTGAGTPATLVRWHEVNGSYTSYPTFAAFTATGREPHGRYQQGQDVYFVDAAAGDYRLVPSSPMQTAGAPLPQDVADAIGVPVTATTPLGALQWPARPADPPPSPLTRPVFRLHHPVAGDQLFTLSSSEAANAEQNYGYVSDGVGFLAATSASAGIVAIFRLRHPATEDRLYTRNPAERDSAVDRYGYTFEGIGFYAASSSSPGLVPVHRLQLGSLHHYAVGDAERDAAVAAGWNYEYVAWYAAPPA